MSSDSTRKLVTLVAEVESSDYGQKVRVTPGFAVNGATEIEFVLPGDAEVKELPWPDWNVGTIVESGSEAYVVMLFGLNEYGSYSRNGKGVRLVAHLDRSNPTALTKSVPTIREFVKENPAYTVLYQPERDLA